MSQKSYLALHHINVTYGSNTVIRDCQFDLERGEILSLLGASGCGKSTLLKAIAGLLPVQKGSIILDRKVLSNKTCLLPPKSRNIGMIFQDYALFPHLTVADNIAFGLHQLARNERHKKVITMLSLVRLTQYAKRYPHELSGGQQQRVAIARALICKPKVLLFDEPFSNLDAEVRTILMQEIKQLLQEQEMTAIFVTHNKTEAFALADKIAIIREGKIAQLGTPTSLYDKPADPQIAYFLGHTVTLAATKVGNGWQTEIGIINEAQSQRIVIEKNNSEKNQVTIYLRSHQIILRKAMNGHNELYRVKNISFLGDFQRYTIETPTQLITMDCKKRLNIGDAVSLSLDLA
ncbi:MAG: ABC transporter ATP-binding protein [Ostreibacterium sp.]